MDSSSNPGETHSDEMDRFLQEFDTPCSSKNAGELSEPDAFTPQPPRKLGNITETIEQLFKGYGPNDRFVKKKAPLLNKSKRNSTAKNETKKVKSARRQKEDYIELEKKMCLFQDPNEYFSALSEDKKPNKKSHLTCSTPRKDFTLHDFATPHFNQIGTPPIDTVPVETPDIRSLRQLDLNTPLPVNVINSPVNNNLSPISPIYLPSELKSTLLEGVYCYVEVKTDREDRSDGVKAELLSLGAKVAKNLTKKVTHVVFKEGRVSTYLKAKKEAKPLVSVLWIEACKKAQGIVDPTLHPPKRMEKYESILPFQTIKKRRIPLLNPKSRLRRNIFMMTADKNFIPDLDKKKIKGKDKKNCDS